MCLGEEVTSRVHINGLNLRERIAPQMQSQSNAYVMKTTVEAVNEQSARLHVPMMAHIKGCRLSFMLMMASRSRAADPSASCP